MCVELLHQVGRGAEAEPAARWVSLRSSQTHEVRKMVNAETKKLCDFKDLSQLAEIGGFFSTGAGTLMVRVVNQQ